MTSLRIACVAALIVGSSLPSLALNPQPERFIDVLVDFIDSTEPARLDAEQWRKLLSDPGLPGSRRAQPARTSKTTLPVARRSSIARSASAARSSPKR